MTPRFQCLMALAWQCGIIRWDLLAEQIPEFVLNGWVEWIGLNGLLPAQRDQFTSYINSGLLSANGFKITPEELMRLRMREPYNPLNDDQDQ